MYSKVVEVDERVTLVGYASDPNSEEHAIQFDEFGRMIRGYRGKGWDRIGDAEGPGEIVRGLSGEAVRIIKKPGRLLQLRPFHELFAESFQPSSDPDSVRSDLRKLYEEGYRSLAVVLVHSYTFPEHERLIGQLAREVGFTHVSESAQLLPMIKMLPRGVSSTADAYLTPILRAYLDGFFNGFDEKLRDGSLRSPRVEFMGSDGGLVDTANFSGLKSILSGPAGGVVGYALTSWDKNKKIPIIGLAFCFFLPCFFINVIPLCTGWTWVGLRRMSRALTVGMKLYTRRQPLALLSNHLNSISIPSPQVEVPV